MLPDLFPQRSLPPGRSAGKSAVRLFAGSLCHAEELACCCWLPGVARCPLNFSLPSPPPQHKHTAAEGLEKQSSFLQGSRIILDTGSGLLGAEQDLARFIEESFPHLWGGSCTHIYTYTISKALIMYGMQDITSIPKDPLMWILLPPAPCLLEKRELLLPLNESRLVWEIGHGEKGKGRTAGVEERQELRVHSFLLPWVTLLCWKLSLLKLEGLWKENRTSEKLRCI